VAKQSKRDRRRMRQTGMSGGGRVVRRVPARFPRRLPHAPLLSAKAHYRLRCREHAARAGVRAAARVVAVPVSTISRWRRRVRPDDLTSLAPRSRRPHRTRFEAGRRRRSRRSWPCASGTRAGARRRCGSCWPARGSRCARR